MATLAIDVLPREVSPGRRALARLFRRPSAVVGLAVVVAFVVVAIAAPLVAPYDPLATSWSAVRKAPSVAHLFGTDELGRDVLARVVYRRAGLAARGRRVGADRSFAGRSARTPRGLRRPLLRRADLARHRRDARHAVPDPRDRARRVPRAQPRERDDRDRHLGDAGLHPAHARPGARGEGRGLRRGRARARQSPVADRAPAHPSQHRAAADRAGDARDRRRGHRRGEPVVPGPGPAAARTELGQHAQHREELRRAGAVDGRVAGALDLRARAVVQPAGRRPARRARSAGRAETVWLSALRTRRPSEPQRVDSLGSDEVA